MICFFYIFPIGYIFINYTGILLVDVPLLVLLAIWLSSGKPLSFWVKGFSLPLVLIIGWMLLATTQSINVGWSLAEIMKWVRGYLLMVVIAGCIRTEKDFWAVVISLLLGFGFQTFLALYQWRYGTLGLWFLGERMFRSEPWRSYGTFYVPSFLANFLIMLLPLTMRLSIFYRSPDRFKRYAFFGLFLAGVVALYTTYGRSSWIGFIVTAGLTVLLSLFMGKLRPRLKWPLAMLTIFAVAFVIRYIPVIERQFGDERQGAVDIRLIQAEVAMKIIQDRYLFGVGPANYELVSPQYIFPAPGFAPWLVGERVHNTYLLLAAENGAIMTLLFLLFCFQFFRIAFKLLRSRNALMINTGFGLAGGMLALMISFVASPDIHNDQTINQMLICAGLLSACLNLSRRGKQRPRKPVPRKILSNKRQIQEIKAIKNSLSMPAQDANRRPAATPPDQARASRNGFNQGRSGRKLQ